MTRLRTRLLRLVLPAVLLVASAGPVTATNYTWNAMGINSYQTSTNWTPNSPAGGPGSADTTQYSSNSTYEVTSTGNVTNTGLQVSQGTWTFGLTSGQVYTVSGANGFSLGTVNGQTANLNLIGGTLSLTASNGFSGPGAGIAGIAGTIGNMTVDGANTTFTTNGNAFIVGYSGAGSLTVQNGASASLGAQSAVSVGGSGSITVTGINSSLMLGANSDIGYSGSGSLSINNGASASIGSGTYISYGGQSTGSVTVGQTGTGTLTLNGAIVGFSSVTTGNLTVNSGSTLNSYGELSLYYGTATSNGTWNQNTGPITVTGGTFNLNGGTVTATAAGTGINVSGGSFNVSGGTLSALTTTAGVNGSSTFTQTGGTHIIGKFLELGVLTGSNGAYALNGGMLRTPTIIQGAGTGTLSLNGGTLQAAADTATFVSGLTAAYVQAGGAVIDSNGHAVTVSQALLHDPALGTNLDGGLTKKGAGTLTLAGANTYTGGTLVAGGTLSVASDAALGAASGAVTLENGSQLVFTASVVTGRTLNLNFSSVAPAAGNSITYAGATVNGGFLYGPGTHVVTGSTFAGTTAFNSAVINVTGAGSFVSFTNGGALSFGPGLPGLNYNMRGFTNQGSGAITLAAGSQVSAADFETYGMLSLAPNSTAAPTILTNTGSTPLYFNGGSQTFIGTSATADPTGQNVVDYVDLHGNNAIVAGGLFVNNGGIYDTVGAGTGTIIAEFGALVKGAGFYQNTVKTQNGGKYQTGNSPGSATFGNFVFGPGGVSNYIFAIDDATGVAGPSPGPSGLVSGWGLIKAVQVALGATTTSGNFTWTATPSNPLTVAIDTLVNPTMVGTDIAGPMADFNPTQSYSWTAARWTGTYSGPTDVAMLDADTSFDTSGFANPIAGTFGWSFDPADQTLSLTYTPSAVPEPGTLALIGLAVAGLACWRRRGQPTGPRA